MAAEKEEPDSSDLDRQDASNFLSALIRGLKRWDERRWGNPKIRVLI